MSVQTKNEQRVWALIDRIADRDKSAIDSVFDLLTWGHYGHLVFSQFGYRLDGYVFRQSPGGVVSTVKVNESGVPLVGFVSAASTMGCISKMLDLLWAERVKWQKDKYPWI